MFVGLNFHLFKFFQTAARIYLKFYVDVLVVDPYEVSDNRFVIPIYHEIMGILVLFFVNSWKIFSKTEDQKSFIFGF